jgi:hypothetical protein
MVTLSHALAPRVGLEPTIPPQAGLTATILLLEKPPDATLLDPAFQAH